MKYPAYINSWDNGQLQKKADQAFNMLSECCLCPRKCQANRLENQLGFCKTAIKPKVYNFMSHHGEEPPISGSCGSGTIFFSNCNMHCAYCQNYQFSQNGQGREVDFKDLAEIMLKLQAIGCHNINLVTPTHVMPQILKSLAIAIPKGLKIPLVYNTSGYELPEAINILDGIVDVYLADMRYADNSVAIKYSAAPNYPKYNQETIKVMHRQVSQPEFDESGIIRRGLIIRHLVLPNNLSGTEKIMKFLASHISKDTYVSLMSQYTPYYKAAQLSQISRRPTHQEYKEAKQIMEQYGLHNGWTQEAGGLEKFAGTNIKSNI